MIKSVTITNFKSETLKLTLTNPEESGLIIESIDGLGPSKATINSTELATMDGSIYNSARQEERNIVMYLIMMFSPTIEDARQKVYRYFPLKKLVKIQIETDNRYVETEGYVESNEPDIFSDQESTQISIICPDPYLYGIGNSATAFSGIQPEFEFEYSNESLDENLTEFGDIRVDQRAIINYKGDTDVGVVMTIHAMGPAEMITVYNVDTRETMKIDTGKILAITNAPFSGGDDLEISTVKGKKYVRLLRNGVYTNVIGAIDKNADWFQLTPGDNKFGFTADSGAENLMIKFDYKIAYGGI